MTDLGPMPHAVLWQNGIATDLGILPGAEDSGAAAINNLGQIVGSSGRTDPESYQVTSQSFIYASARAAEDYVARSGALAFTPGETSRTVAVTVVGDRRREGDEVFYLNLSSAAGAVVTDTQGAAIVRNDDR